MALVHTEQNQKILEGMPHRNFEDLSIIYRWVIDSSEEVASIMIHNKIAEQLGYSEETLHQLAMENTKRLFPVVIKPMREMLQSLFVADGISEEVAGQCIGAAPWEEEAMYVITNEKGVNGAASILYPEVLQQLAGKLKGDYYILPSSVHETIAVPACMGEPEEMAEMVCEINLSQVAPGERLSNQVYYYDSEQQTMSQALDESQIKQIQKQMEQVME